MSFKRCYQCSAEATYVKKYACMYFTGLQHTCILRACKVFTGVGLFKCNLDNKELHLITLHFKEYISNLHC